MLGLASVNLLSAEPAPPRHINNKKQRADVKGENLLIYVMHSRLTVLTLAATAIYTAHTLRTVVCKLFTFWLYAS